VCRVVGWGRGVDEAVVGGPDVPGLNVWEATTVAVQPDSSAAVAATTTIRRWAMLDTRSKGFMTRR